MVMIKGFKHKTKVLCVLLVFLLAVCGIPNVSFAATIDQVTISGPTAESGVVRIDGKHSGGAGKVVTVHVLRPQSTEELFVDQSLTDSQGNFEFSYTMDLNQDQSGIYSIEISGAGVNTTAAKDYLFMSLMDEQNIKDQINGAEKVGSLDGTEAGTIVNIIHNHSSVFEQIGFDDPDGFKGFSDSEKTSVYATLLDSDFSDVYAIMDTLERAIAIQCLNNTSADKVITVINKYPDVYKPFNMGAGSDYEQLKNKSPVYTALTGKNFGLKDMDTIEKTFEGAVGLQKFNEVDASNRGNLLTYIQTYKAYIGLSDSQMTELTSRYNFTVMQNILNGQPFATLASVKEAILDALSDDDGDSNTSEEPSHTVIKSSGGGGGGGGGGTYIPPIANNENTAVNPDENSFSDISIVPWAVESIRLLAQKGIVSGDGNGAFSPNELVTREQFLKMLIKTFNINLLNDMASSDVASNGVTRFTDVDSSQWYYQYIATAEKLGLVNGSNDGTFGVGAPITREEMAVMVFRFTKYSNVDLAKQKEQVQFADDSEIEDYAKEAVVSLQEANILNGVGDNLFAPKDHSTRAMAAKVLYSVLANK